MNRGGGTVKNNQKSLRELFSNSRYSIIGVVCCLAVAAVWFAFVQPRPAGAPASGPGSVGAASSGPIALVQATVVGDTRFPNGDTPHGGHGQAVDGIQANLSEQVAYHIHAHLSLFDNGRQVAVPRGIGIVPPRVVQNGFVVGGQAFYWLHTHDATGIIHIESPVRKLYTLAQFFAVWGEPLTRRDVAGMNGAVTAFLNGKPYGGKLGAITLVAHAEITLEVGQPVVPPPVYTFPPGL